MKLLSHFRISRVPYWYLVGIPILLMVFGTASNESVLIANWGKFPVMVNEREQAAFRQQCAILDSIDGSDFHFTVLNTSVQEDDPNCNGQFLDKVHSVMGHNSRLKFLADIFNLGDGIYSAGDLFLLFGNWLLGYGAIMWLGLALRKLILFCGIEY